MKNKLFIYLCIIICFCISINLVSALTEVEVIYDNNTNYLIRYIVNGDYPNCILNLHENESVTFINISYPFNLLREVEDELNAKGVYLEPIIKNLNIAQKITFALGAIIDNIIDGFVRIVGNLIVTGKINSTAINTTDIYSKDIESENLNVTKEATIVNATIEQLNVSGNLSYGSLTTSRVRVTKDDAQTFNYGGPHIIAFDDEVFDTLGEYNTGTYTFTPLNAGYYSISSALEINSGSNDNTGRNVQLRVYVGGNWIAQLDSDCRAESAGDIYTVSGSIVLYLPAGATGAVTIRLYSNLRVGGTGQNILSSATVQENWVTIHRLS